MLSARGAACFAYSRTHLFARLASSIAMRRSGYLGISLRLRLAMRLALPEGPFLDSPSALIAPCLPFGHLARRLAGCDLPGILQCAGQRAGGGAAARPGGGPLPLSRRAMPPGSFTRLLKNTNLFSPCPALKAQRPLPRLEHGR